ncbi:MAG TPA: Hsp20/alpha crystallin family protein [Prolixibacteraceae bacterium]|nr:Hsp20/alpha crystallin family protein [Prolixibacteraceae bacterium]
MNLVRFRNPHYHVNKNLVDDLFTNYFKNDYHEDYAKNCGCQPAANVLETEKDFQVELLLPGFPKEDVQMNYHNNLLTVKMDKKVEEENEEKKEEFKYGQREFGPYNFEKQFKVPNSVDAENIKAKFDNGILRITLPKKEEALEKDPIDIQIA